MMNRTVSLAPGLALLIGAVVTVPASAATTVYDTSGATISCGTVIGSAKIKPPITAAATGTAAIKVKAVLGGCVVSGTTVPASPPLTVVSGKVSGTLSSSGSPGCAGLLLPATLTGNLTAKWKTATGQKLDFPSTIASGGTITGGVYTPAAPFSGSFSYGVFTLSGQTLAGGSAFAAGAPSTKAATTEDIGELGNACGEVDGRKGIKLINLSFGEITL